LAAAGLLFAAVFGLRMAVAGSGSGVAFTFLYVLPIALVALELGTAGGIAAGAVGVALFGAWAALTSTPQDVLAFLSRAVPLLLIGGLTGRLAIQRRALARSETRYRTLLENVPDMVISTFDHDLRLDYTAGEALAAMGRSTDEFFGKRVSEVVPPEHAEVLERNFKAALQGERPSFDYTSSLGDREMWIKVVPLRDEHGNVSGGMSVSQDVTERKRAEERAARLAAVVDCSDDAIVSKSSEGIITSWNRGAASLYGYSLKEAIGHPVSMLIPPARHDEEKQILEHILAGDRIDNYETERRRKDGSLVEVSLTVSPIRDREGTIVGASAIARDISARKRQEAALRESEERFKNAFEHAPIGMALVQPDDAGTGRIIRANEALSRMSGYSRQDLLSTSFAAITYPDDKAAETPLLERLIAGEISTYDIEKRCLNSQGNIFWASFHASAARDSDGRVKHLIVQVEDVTERKRFEGQLQYLADHDALTGLFNRRRFEEELSRQTALSVRYGQGGAVLVLDLDNFKYLNDTLGHKAGDEAIGQTALLLTRRLRDSDVIGRLGGDEFAILLPAADESQARAVAGDLTAAIREKAFTFNGQRLGLTASVGIATFAGDVELSGEEVLVDADLAMYDAKEQGRNRYAVFTADRLARMEARLTWSERIRQALENDRFVLFAQPILDLELGRVTRHELLLRMIGDDGELIPPASFLHIAERFGLIRDIDHWVVRNAIRLIDEQRRQGHTLSLEVNLSGKSVSDSELPKMIASELRDRSIDPGSLIFEVTETAAIVNITEAQQFAATLTELGCHFALDDFGAGFGSFYYLKHLPFDYLKIDGEFIRNLSTTHSDQLVVKAVVEIAQGLGKRTIAEFVTNAETTCLLRDLGVDYAQGYHIGRPRRITETLNASATSSLEPDGRLVAHRT
jgi:diguanylate cyclase (GGDEF)-like protein/PAS domain S-box-containing protein